MSEVIVSTGTFSQEVLESDIPVLVDFWATWCGPCRMLAPVISQLAADYAGKVKVCKVDVDENPTLASQYGISSIPCLKVFKGGQVVAGSVGLQPRAAIESMLTNL